MQKKGTITKKGLRSLIPPFFRRRKLHFLLFFAANTTSDEVEGTAKGGVEKIVVIDEKKGTMYAEAQNYLKKVDHNTTEKRYCKTHYYGRNVNNNSMKYISCLPLLAGGALQICFFGDSRRGRRLCLLSFNPANTTGNEVEGTAAGGMGKLVCGRRNKKRYNTKHDPIKIGAK